MATYSDPMVGYADFESTGRSFAWVMAASAVLGAIALWAANGGLPRLAGSPSELAFAAMIGWTGCGVSALLAICVLGSLLISKRAKDIFVVSADGILRRGAKGQYFLPREEILGISEVKAGSLLITADPARKMLLPAWLGRRGACLEELAAMGVRRLPPLKTDVLQYLAGDLIPRLLLTFLFFPAGMLIARQGSARGAVALSSLGGWLAVGIVLGTVSALSWGWARARARRNYERLVALSSASPAWFDANGSRSDHRAAGGR